MNPQQQHANSIIQGQPQFQQQQQQSSMMNNQQAGGGGVLSNLLSSGKQIIGAATTPRAPNQPMQFPSMMGAGMAGMMEGSGNYPLNRANLMQSNFNNDPSSHQIGHNSFALAGNQMQQPMQQQQQQPQQPMQQQHYNQMSTSMSRGPMNQMTGEEQGGNILNTVKNMFKL